MMHTIAEAADFRLETDGGKTLRVFQRKGVRYACRICRSRARAVLRGSRFDHLLADIRRLGVAGCCAAVLAFLARRREDRLRRRGRFYHEVARKEHGVELDPRRAASPVKFRSESGGSGYLNVAVPAGYGVVRGGSRG